MIGENKALNKAKNNHIIQENQSEEIWKTIEDYGGKYAISNKGNVKSIARLVPNHGGFYDKPEKILKQCQDMKGYKRVYLLAENGKSKFVLIHRLVAKAFISNPENKPQVNHIDGDKTNNTVENLEWITNKDNCVHAIKTGLNNHSTYKNKRAVLQLAPVTENIIARFKTISEAEFAVSSRKRTSNISLCCKGKVKTSLGYKWRYADE